MLNPVKKNTVVYEIIDRIIATIVAGEITPGQRLPSERDLAEVLCVSRSSIREALKILEFNKVITIKPGHGAFLLHTPIDEQNLLYAKTPIGLDNPVVQRIELRLILEPVVARLVAANVTEDELKVFENIVNNMEVLVNEHATSGFALEDLNFHYFCAQCTRNEALFKIMKEQCIGPHHIIAFGNVLNLEEESFEQHKLILKAFKAHDVDLAENLMREHMYYSMDKNLTATSTPYARERFAVISGKLK